MIEGHTPRPGYFSEEISGGIAEAISKETDAAALRALAGVAAQLETASALHRIADALENGGYGLKVTS